MVVFDGVGTVRASILDGSEGAKDVSDKQDDENDLCDQDGHCPA